MPGFLRRRPLLRAAAIGGGAYQMGKRRAYQQDREASQEQRIAELESQPPPAPTPATTPGISSDAMQKLQELGQLHDQGVLTDDEFSTQKERLLAR
jgi:hypothetical protein